LRGIEAEREKRVPIEIDPAAREREVLRWAAEGKTAAEIGGILGIAERTVNFHIRNIFEKLGAANKVQAVVKAISGGLIDAG
jgi:LuxR family quorum-sensing system transcriptional regulator SolR